MPLRARLQNSGLKLKIPVRPSSAVTNSPYAGGRHSASPGRRGETRGRPEWPSEAPTVERSSPMVCSFPASVPCVQAFDASVDCRPVWEVKAERRRTSGDGFRAIPIEFSPTSCDRVCDTADDGEDPAEPLATKPPDHRGSPLEAELQLLTQRARHLRDWFHRLSPVSSPNYSSRYLSSPVPRFRSRTRSGRSPSR